MSHHGERIRNLYEAALRRPPGARASYVAQVAGADTELRERVGALLSGQQDTVLPGYEPASEQAEQLLATGTQIGTYRIEGPLGAGGMGIVYFATDTKLNRPAAIKVLPGNLADPEARRRFQREAQLVSSLNHPHIVTVYDAGEYGERQYLITEYVDGGTLRQWASLPRSWQTIVELLIGVADGIATAHDAGILHRDIKPENILLAKNGYAKLADFGIAKLLESDPLADDPHASLPSGDLSSRVGTAAYMSPEQLQGLPLDARSDVYSFGLMLYELLAARRAFAQADAAQSSRTLAPLGPEIPAELRTIVAKALEEEPADRYQSLRDLVVDLRRLVRRSGLEAGELAGSQNATRPQRPWSRPAVYLLAALAAVAVALLAREYTRAALDEAPNRNAVVVLPFANESTNTDDATISERLGDRLREQLQELPDIDVVGRVSSVSFGGEQVDLRTIARTLGVAMLINGSVQRHEQMLEVRVEILDSRGFTVQPFYYERPESELLALQREIADDVAAYLAPASARAIARSTSTTSQAETANMLIGFGSHFEHEVKDDISIDTEKLQRAIDFYRRAVAADPNSVEAHSRLAAALLYAGDVEEAGGPLQAALRLGQSLVAGERSVELSLAYNTAALYLVATRKQGADAQYERAIESNPGNVEALGSYAQWLMTHNRSIDAEPYFQEAIRLEPRSLARYVDYAEYLGIREEMDRLRAVGREIEARFPNARGYLKLARVYELTGDLDIGIAWGLKAYRTLTEEAGPQRLSAASRRQLEEDVTGQIAELYARIDELESASKFEPRLGIGQLFLRRDYDALVDVAAVAMIDRPQDLDVQYYLAFGYNATDDFANARRILESLGFPLPEFGPITGTESQAYTYYIDALQSLGGNAARVVDLARKRVEYFTGGIQTGMHRSWWLNTLLACSYAQLDEIPEAMTALDRVYSAHGLPSLPLLQDSPCFKPLAKEPRYRALIEPLEDRRSELRRRLPSTLQEHGVADVRP